MAKKKEVTEEKKVVKKPVTRKPAVKKAVKEEVKVEITEDSVDQDVRDALKLLGEAQAKYQQIGSKKANILRMQIKALRVRKSAWK